MVPLRYWVMRTLRRHTPQRLVDAMLDRGAYIKPGRDTSAPWESVQAYSDSLATHDLSLEDRTVCVVGFGGGFGIGLHLLEAGARRVILQDPFAPERSWRNSRFIDQPLLEKYLQRRGDHWEPRGERLVVVRKHLEDYAPAHSADVVISNSVLEHVTDVDTLLGASAQLMTPGGIAVHFIDLRDHYFRYPFEMLSYTQQIWDRWLNASNTLNRLRLGDYERIFRSHFADVDVDVVSSLTGEFAQAKARIRPEFLTGNDETDSAAIIRVIARRPACHERVSINKPAA